MLDEVKCTMKSILNIDCAYFVLSVSRLVFSEVIVFVMDVKIF